MSKFKLGTFEKRLSDIDPPAGIEPLHLCGAGAMLYTLPEISILSERVFNICVLELLSALILAQRVRQSRSENIVCALM